jgi:hypothetical protein
MPVQLLPESFLSRALPTKAQTSGGIRCIPFTISFFSFTFVLFLEHKVHCMILSHLPRVQVSKGAFFSYRIFIEFDTYDISLCSHSRSLLFFSHIVSSLHTKGNIKISSSLPKAIDRKV